MAESRKPNPERVPEKVKEITVEKEEGYLYFIDKDGDVARVPAKWNKDPRFLEKVKEDEMEVERKIKRLQEHYPRKTEPHHEPIPKHSPDIPEKFQGKEIVYIDKTLIGTINDESLTKNQVTIYNKEVFSFNNPENLVHNITTASVTASLLFEGLKAQGTNIILTLDTKSDLKTAVIPRFEKDGLELLWEMKQGDLQEIKNTAEKIKQALVIGKITDFNTINEDEKKEIFTEKKKVNIIDSEKLKEDEEKINYEIEHISQRWA